MKGSHSKQTSPHRRGAAALECAIVLPLALSLILAVCNLGWIFSVRQQALFAAREGARDLSLQGSSLTDSIALTQSYLTAANIQTATITGHNAYAGNGSTAEARKVWIEVRIPSAGMLLADPFGMFSAFPTQVMRVTMRKEGELLPAP